MMTNQEMFEELQKSHRKVKHLMRKNKRLKRKNSKLNKALDKACEELEKWDINNFDNTTVTKDKWREWCMKNETDSSKIKL